MACPTERSLDFQRAMARGFGNHPSSEHYERWPQMFAGLRTVAAFDDGEIVGTSGSFLAPTSVPGGGSLTAALVTVVTVAATHRRRGVMTNMMHRLLREARERGEPIATLWASESVIYGRFGYGMAGQHHWAEIETQRAHIAHMPGAPGRTRFASRERLREVGPDVWRRAFERRPGMPLKGDLNWELSHPLPVDESKRDQLRFYVTYEEDGRCDGYLVYKSKESGIPDAGDDITVDELITATDAAQAALTRFALSIDLSRKVTFPSLATDDPLWWMLSDPRQLRRRAYDAIWLRLLDAPAALAARKYAVEGEIVFEVADSFLPECGGTFTLSAGPGGATCRPSTAAPDIALPTASLAACYFGGASFASLARAGRVEERTPGALLRADAMFAAERAPWCPMGY